MAASGVALFARIGEDEGAAGDVYPFIKVGQALSIRSDLLSEAYCEALATLQDACPPFDDAEARAHRRGAGPVYRGYVDDGDERVRVAVKVQRPGVAETIALDLHLLRVVGAPLRKIANLNTDLVGIVDAWGVRFVDELDYRREAKNARNFIDSISQTPLADAVFAPKPVEAASSRRVLATRWVDGQRLDADLDPGLQVAYIEHIAHLVAKDYASVPADLVKLGFVPEGYEEAIAGGDAVQVLSDVYTAFAGGGGAAKIDVPEVVGEMRALADRQGNLFRLPPYFAYIARAFSVLEGIGLQNDPDYAIVGECLPYVSQRLLSDPSPRVAGALDTFAIVEREFAKLLGASARTSFAEARKSRAGVLAATLVDPFGVLEPIAKSKLLAPDRDDKMALATLSRVASAPPARVLTQSAARIQ
ncbi:hypothetical protein JL722_5121 [Aureococcus anophagefferens]|nr:hypothetical protein JL722_5121 [Aureococcus anophagefferens]